MLHVERRVLFHCEIPGSACRNTDSVLLLALGFTCFNCACSLRMSCAAEHKCTCVPPLRPRTRGRPMPAGTRRAPEIRHVQGRHLAPSPHSRTHARKAAKPTLGSFGIILPKPQVSCLEARKSMASPREPLPSSSTQQFLILRHS